MASIVRPASEPEVEHPFDSLTYEELRAELLAEFANAFPEFRIVPAPGQALIAGMRER